VFAAIQAMAPFDWLKQAVAPNANRELRPIEKDANGSQYEGEWVGN